MRVHFSSERLQRLCESEKELRKRYGRAGERVIRQRLDDMIDADNLAVLRTLAGHFEELQHDLKGFMSVRAHDGMRIIFRPHAQPPAKKADGGLDLVAITAIVIDSIQDYH